MGIIRCRMQGGCNLGGMMCIIIHNGDTADGALVFESAVCTGETVQGRSGNLAIDLQQIGQGNGSNGIAYVMLSGNLQRKTAGHFSMPVKSKGRMTELVKSNIRGIIIGSGPVTVDRFFIKSDHATVQISCDLL